jgi:hypothetical protein
MFILLSVSAFGQSDKMQYYLANPIIADSLSCIMIPIQLDISLLSANKLSYGEYYANILFYDFKKDAYKKLFETDTYIKGFDSPSNIARKNSQDNFSRKWIFYFVKSFDYSKNGKIDGDDPYILYVTDKSGNSLKPLTLNSENAVSINIYEEQGFALIKLQRDLDKDNDFENSDKDFYYIRLDLETLKLGSKIEIKE